MIRENAQFSLAHFEHMVELGAFAGEFARRLELIHGEIVDRNPIGPPHADFVDRLAKWSMQVVDLDAIRVRIQGSVRFPGSNSQLQPDICWLRNRSYRRQHPGPDDVMLVIEVADSSL